MPPKEKEKAITTEDVAPLIAPGLAPDEAQASAPRVPKMSEGVRHDLATIGRATEPNTGDLWEMDRDTGVVTVTDRDGNASVLDVPDPRRGPKLGP